MNRNISESSERKNKSFEEMDDYRSRCPKHFHLSLDRPPSGSIEDEEDESTLSEINETERSKQMRLRIQQEQQQQSHKDEHVAIDNNGGIFHARHLDSKFGKLAKYMYVHLHDVCKTT